MHIPSREEIHQTFQKNITYRPWRVRTKGGQPPVVFTPQQQDFFDYLLEIESDLREQRLKLLPGVIDRKTLLARGRHVRRVLRRAQGLNPWPVRRPLKPLITRGFDRDGYRLEHLIIESRPACHVTANLYIPQGPGPFPAVLFVMGHSPVGKAAETYQGMCSVLAREGFAVLAFDPAGQGERDEYADRDSGKRTVARACRMHGAAGDPAYLLGLNFGGYRLWDAVRCVDYLQSRPDILSNRIGVSGISGGGWEALWLGALDTRIKAVNSNCYLTSFRRRLENRCMDAEPDPEQDPFDLLSAGIGASDLLLAVAPRAVSLGVTIFDFFPVDGALEAYAEAKACFQAAGLEEKLSICVDDAGHSFTPALREQCYAWMHRWLKDGAASPAAEPDWIVEKEKDTFCTPQGNVLLARGGRSTAELNGHMAAEAARIRIKARRERGPGQDSWVKRKLIELLRLAPIENPLEAERGDTVETGRIHITPLQIRSDGQLRLQARFWCNPQLSSLPAIVRITPKAGGYEPLRDPFCRSLARAGFAVLDLDPRGMGPVDEAWLDFVPLTESNLVYDAFLLGRVPSGLRVADIMRAVTLLLAEAGEGIDRIGICGEGYGALLALLAGMLDERIAGVAELYPLANCSSLAWSREYAWPVNMIIPDLLNHMDLEDIRAGIAPRPLLTLNPLDHLKQPLGPAAIRREFDYVRKAYGKGGDLQVKRKPKKADMLKELVRFFKSM